MIERPLVQGRTATEHDKAELVADHRRSFPKVRHRFCLPALRKAYGRGMDAESEVQALLKVIPKRKGHCLTLEESKKLGTAEILDRNGEPGRVKRHFVGREGHRQRTRAGPLAKKIYPQT